MNRHLNGGLTLVEVMIVIAVIAVLTGVGYPLYTDYIIKSRRADARIALEQIAHAQERYNTVSNTYTDDLNLLNLSGPLDDNIASDGDDSTTVSEAGYYTIAVDSGTVSATVFDLSAAPVSGKSQANDTDCTGLTLDEQGIKGGSGADSSKCW
ncbi:MAG: type IV pilin protein [Sedimenticola sp.]